MRKMDQHKALTLIKRNSALEQLSGDMTTLPNLTRTNELVEKANRLGGEDLKEFIKDLKTEAIQKNWYTTARQNYKKSKKELAKGRQLEIKKCGFFSSQHLVCWVQMQVLKNIAKKAGVAGVKYHIKRLFGKV